MRSFTLPSNARDDWNQVTPKTVEGIAQRLRLKDIVLSHIELQLMSASFPLPLDINAKDLSISYWQRDEWAGYETTYRLTITDGNGDLVTPISCKLALLFATNGVVTDEELRAFGEAEVFRIAHPYLRELLNTMTRYMNIPHLVLEVFTRSQPVAA